MAVSPEHVPGEVVQLPGGITSIDHRFTLPLRWTCPSSDATITVFARELVLGRNAKDQNLPMCIFLQGGPGFPSPRTMGPGGWVGRALKDFRVLLLDQRGTGKSTPVTAAGMALMESPEAQAEYLGHFRSDNIVSDCEAIRKMLLADPNDSEAAPKKWTVLGQSYGGFCLATYLSRHPDAIEAGLFTGGLPPLRDVDEIYRATYRRCAERNRRYYARYPGDVSKVKSILQFLAEQPRGGMPLPGGGLLTPRRFLQLGLMLGGSAGMESLHYMVDEAWEQGGALAYCFLRAVENAQAFDTNPIYTLLHEPIYMWDGAAAAPRWSAQRVLEADAAVAAAFDWRGAVNGGSAPAYFTGEMVYRWMLDGDYAQLEGLKGAAELLAERTEWTVLYDKDALSKCQVPCAAAVYYDDMYVEREFSEELAQLMPDCKIWVTNEYQHSGLRDDGAIIFEKLLGMTRNEVMVPS
ncbi:proline iminopeptidase [Tribonema minus]|uniref:Proline iminopeptidase n=1 Tax=Tribonema minus TaxID=303371 RepID=A0A835ZBB4_9STRA|nr:proline iminopeptidase [Tribonema minus]